VLTPLIKGVTSDNYFISVNATREDEAMGMVAGAWMGGMKGAVDAQLLPRVPAERSESRDPGATKFYA
jgi:sulfopyruvate decarboxylase TPP-binding subunit